MCDYQSTIGDRTVSGETIKGFDYRHATDREAGQACRERTVKEILSDEAMSLRAQANQMEALVRALPDDVSWEARACIINLLQRAKP